MGAKRWLYGLWQSAFGSVDTRREYVRQNLPPIYSPTAQLSRGTRLALIARVQDGIRNQPILHGLVERFVTEVIGTGLAPDLVVDHELVGLSEKETREKEREIEKKFKFYCRSKISICETMNLYDLQRVRYRSKKASGDVLVNTPIINGNLRIELIESEQVTTPNHLEDTTSVIDGTQVDRFRRPTHFYIQQTHPGEYRNSFEWRRIRAVDVKGRTRVFLDKETMRPGQVRGVPTLATVLDCLHKMDEYSRSELEAALNASDPAIFIKSPFTHAKSTSTGEKEPIELYPGAIIDLAPGEDITTPTPGRPNPEYAPFIRQKMLEVSIAAKIPLEVLLMLFSASFSASRAGFLMWKKIVNEERQLSSRPDDQIFSIWLDNEVEQGRIDIPGYEETKDFWKTLTWTGPALGSIKELEQIKAATSKIEAGLSTRKKEIAELGHDVNEIDAVLDQDPKTTAQTPPPTPQQSEDNANVSSN